MTAMNMARHRNSPHMAFWKMIKEGNDHFEVTRQEPKVDFCEKKYVFDAVKTSDAKHEPVFEASAKCPVYIVPDEVADAVREKQQADDAEFAKLVAKGTPVAQLNTGIDGGMHRVFAARVPNGNTGLSEAGPGPSLFAATEEKAPGTIPDTVNPPRGPVTSPNEPLAASLGRPPSTSTASSTRVASAAPAAQSVAPTQSGESEGFFSSLARKVGLGGNAAADTTATTTQPTTPAKPKVADVKPKPAKTDTKQASAKPGLKPAVSDTAADTPAPAAAPAASNSLVAGAQPVVSANSFESRFSAGK
jgi:hypothetical protein